MSGMNVVFRVDASNAMGTGHVMRCRTLATALRRRGARVQFITRAHDGHLGDMLAREGFAVTLLPRPESAPGARGREDYAAWLGVSPQDDAGQTIAALDHAQNDWLIVDHYGLDQSWEERLRPHARKLMVIDDLANRPHASDVLLDQNYAVDGPARYQPWVQVPCCLLLGPRYALLRPEYAQYRETMVPRSGEIKRVLVYLGGADNADNTGKVLAALSEPSLAHLEVEVVIGPNFIHKQSVTVQAAVRPHTRIHGHLPHLAGLMAQADLAIGAGGATTWERLCMGLPSLVLSIADNQLPACEALASSGLIEYLGRAGDLDAPAIEAAVLASLAASGALRTLAMDHQSLVDGMGVERIAETLYPTPVDQLTVRPAAAGDALRFFAWANDPEVRSRAIDSASADIATHGDWFSRCLTDANSNIYVLEASGLPVGQVRFERRSGEATIAHSLDALVQGRDWENQLIKLGIEALNNSRPTRLATEINPKKIAPVASFVRSLRLTQKSCGEKQGPFSIAILSDRTSWINRWLPEMISRWLATGHRVLWAHDTGALQDADFCFYLSFSKIVPAEVRARYRHNLVVHESDLPQGKGWSPLTWQILEGKSRIPVTLIEAADKVDSGVIYAQEWIEFRGGELIDEMRHAQAEATMSLCQLFVNDFPAVARGAWAQKGIGSFYARRRADDSRLDHEASLASQFNLLRVVDNQNYPAFIEVSGARYELHIKKSLSANEVKNA
jgi:UDP-2,4-diacetamido-2,4,6-trideoxy-beta-L-altropyranose hydrolase